MTQHPFAHAFQCTRVPVSEVPITPEHPTGYRWERACLCPDWQNLDSEIVERVDMVDGKPVPVKRLIKVGGCGRKLLLWVIASGNRQAQAALAESAAHRAETQGLSSAVMGGLAYVAATMTTMQTALVRSTEEESRLIGAGEVQETVHRSLPSAEGLPE